MKPSSTDWHERERSELLDRRSMRFEQERRADQTYSHGIRAVHYDEYGRKVGESLETPADFQTMLPKRGRSPVEQVTDQWKGTQRRPTRRDTTDRWLAERLLG